MFLRRASSVLPQTRSFSLLCHIGRVPKKGIKRWYKDVTVAEYIPEAEGDSRPVTAPTSDKPLYTVRLDNRTLITPALNKFWTPSYALAAMVATELDTVEEKIKISNLPLFQMSITANDLLVDNKDTTIKSFMRSLNSDPICSFHRKDQIMSDLTDEYLQPMVQWTESKFGHPLSVVNIDEFQQPQQSPELIETIKEYLVSGLRGGEWGLVGVEVARAVLNSPFLSLALSEGAIGVEQAWRASNIEEIAQQKKYGRLEHHHLRDAFAVAEISQAAAFVRLIQLP
eukprot:TRINITY_DN5673_c0_g1_i1.p1 TRINITY_DN5673_c0_g1~~TRINITY_DN5673_c0_g1_i1.p1  ORF type:complete len:284 (+),score=81.61 TRINITY_DN5673_c0_g1_i1:10-861(+)